MITKDIFQGVIDFSSFIDNFKQKGSKVNFMVYFGVITLWVLAILSTPFFLCLDLILFSMRVIISKSEKKQFIKPMRKNGKRN